MAGMARNAYVPQVPVTVTEEPVTVDGVPVPVREADSLPLTRLHFRGWLVHFAGAC
jgi:hypothetical protein